MNSSINSSIIRATSNFCNMTALTSSKNALRQEIKDILKNINLEEKRKQSANIFKKVSLKMTYKSMICFRLSKRLCYIFNIIYKSCNFYNITSYHFYSYMR